MLSSPSPEASERLDADLDPLGGDEELESAEALREIEEREPTVWPDRPIDALDRPIEECGLSVDPEDLGAQWLGTATEQGNFESSARARSDGVQIIETPPRSRRGPREPETKSR